MNYKRYDIVIIPPQEITDQAVALSEALAPLGTFFVLDGVTLHPHISLYHVPFEEEILPSVIETLRNLASTLEPFVLKQETYYPDQGVWIGVRYTADKAILDLHTSVINATKGFRKVEDDERYKARWADLDHEQRKNLEDSGWADAYTRYFPHLTFTKLNQPIVDVLAHLPQREFSFLVDHIGVFELGDNGTCTHLIADFWLEKGKVVE